MLQKPLEEQDKAETLKRRLTVGWMVFWVTVALFFGTFTAGYWLVYPATDQTIWPMWFVLAISVSKVVVSLVYVFGKKLAGF